MQYAYPYDATKSAATFLKCHAVPRTWKSRDSRARAVDVRSMFLIVDIINYIRMNSSFERSRMFLEQRLLYCTKIT